jgi:hypothetical protein
MWAWGLGHLGQIGNGGTALNNHTPALVASGSWRQVAAGENFMLALDSDEWVWGWGTNAAGELGVPAVGSASLVPTRVVNLHVAAPITPGTPVVGASPYTPQVSSIVLARRRFTVHGARRPSWIVRLRLYRWSNGAYRPWRWVSTHSLRSAAGPLYRQRLRLGIKGRWMVRAGRRTRLGTVFLGDPAYFTVR